MPWLTQSELRSDSQDMLADFVWADLSRAFTLLDLARTGHYGAEQTRRAIGKARAVLETVRSFLTRIDSNGAKRKIHARADELEAALSSIDPSGN